MKAKLMFCTVLLVFAATPTMGDEAESGNKPLSFSVAILKPTGDHVKRSVMRSMMNYNWEVDKVGDTFVEGKIKNNRVRVDFDAAYNVKISGSDGTSEKWLRNIRKDIWIELTFCGGI